MKHYFTHYISIMSKS